MKEGAKMTNYGARLTNVMQLFDSDSLENFKNYVDIHGEKWFEKYCGSLEELIEELYQFSQIH